MSSVGTEPNNGSSVEHAASGEQLESLRRICRRLSAIGGGPVPEKLDTMDDVIGGLSSLVEVCARRLKNKKDDEIELRQIRDELDEVERLKARFIRNVSHELRTPLASIDGFARALLKMETVGPTESSPEMVSPETRRQFLSIVSQEAQRLGKLIEDVLDLSEIETRGTRREATHFCAKDLFADVMTSFSNTQNPPQVTQRISPEPDGPMIYADREAMVEVLRQLISNAQKFSAGQPVVVGAELVTMTPKNAAPAAESGPRSSLNTVARLYVKDKGIGIPKDELDNIFEKFYKVEHPGATFPGTGLGLSIVRALATQNNGRVWATSEVGRGSTFYVMLPTQQS
jgi:signal transduction histidine kinase